ncbi:hypothetical protein [Acinetobacter nosocomialis]|uniref:Uncharacterized protein n=1 Tax=Acinetobacter nosocomialis TaxID=106654 RepID=A0A2L1VEF2_ACINO|nr:hypothetical protein [Acinetobacter nosocomialis]AVF43574.1 hypothetical protein AL533_03795 [Acinetobacter nosocomialis]
MGIKKPNVQKSGKIATPPENNIKDEECLVFSFRYTQNNHCLSKCEKHEKLDLLDSIFQRREMTWKEIIVADRHKLGSEKIERKSLKVTVPNSVPKDAKIWALRFCDLAPMVGYYENNIFYILWLDRAFKVYKH